MARRFLILLVGQLVVVLLGTVTPVLFAPCEPEWRQGVVTSLIHYPSDKPGSLNYNVPARWVIEVAGEDERMSFPVGPALWAMTFVGDDARYTVNCAGCREVITMAPRARR